MPKDANKKQNKDKKHFTKDFKAELKRVIWPTPKQLFSNTLAVITIVLITAAIVFVLDVVFEKINEQGIEKLKSVVETRENTISNEITDEHDHEHDEEANTTTTDTESNDVSSNEVNE